MTNPYIISRVYKQAYDLFKFDRTTTENYIYEAIEKGDRINMENKVIIVFEGKMIIMAASIERKLPGIKYSNTIVHISKA